MKASFQGSMAQGGLEPLVALGRENLGPASVLSRTDGQGKDFAGDGVLEKTFQELNLLALRPFVSGLNRVVICIPILYSKKKIGVSTFSKHSV